MHTRILTSSSVGVGVGVGNDEREEEREEERGRARRELPGASFLDTPPITPVSRGSASRRGAYNLFSPDKRERGASRRGIA